MGLIGAGGKIQKSSKIGILDEKSIWAIVSHTLRVQDLDNNFIILLDFNLNIWGLPIVGRLSSLLEFQL